MTKKYQICHHQIRFFELKMHQNLGELTTLPRPPSRLDPLPIPLPARRLRRLELGAYGASVLRPPQHKILVTPVLVSCSASRAIDYINCVAFNRAH